MTRERRRKDRMSMCRLSRVGWTRRRKTLISFESAWQRISQKRSASRQTKTFKMETMQHIKTLLPNHWPPNSSKMTLLSSSSRRSLLSNRLKKGYLKNNMKVWRNLLVKRKSRPRLHGWWKARPRPLGWKVCWRHWYVKLTVWALTNGWTIWALLRVRGTKVPMRCRILPVRVLAWAVIK